MIMGNAVQGNHDYDQIMDHHRHREDEFIKMVLNFDNFRGERTLNSVWVLKHILLILVKLGVQHVACH